MRWPRCYGWPLDSMISWFAGSASTTAVVCHNLKNWSLPILAETFSRPADDAITLNVEVARKGFTSCVRVPSSHQMMFLTKSQMDKPNCIVPCSSRVLSSSLSPFSVSEECKLQSKNSLEIRLTQIFVILLAGFHRRRRQLHRQRRFLFFIPQEIFSGKVIIKAGRICLKNITNGRFVIVLEECTGRAFSHTYNSDVRLRTRYTTWIKLFRNSLR